MASPGYAVRLPSPPAATLVLNVHESKLLKNGNKQAINGTLLPSHNGAFPHLRPSPNPERPPKPAPQSDCDISPSPYSSAAAHDSVDFSPDRNSTRSFSSPPPPLHPLQQLPPRSPPLQELSTSHPDPNPDLLPESDEQQTSQLWTTVLQHKNEQLARAELVSVSATTDDPSFTPGNMPNIAGVSIDLTFRCTDLAEHFKARGAKFKIDSATTTDIPASGGNNEKAKLLLSIITDIKRDKASCNSLEELRDMVQTHLAPRDYSPAANTPAAWHATRFIRINTSHDKDICIKWQRVQRASPNPTPTTRPTTLADVTYWLTKPGCRIDLDMQMRGTTYFVDREHAAICPYLSIELRMDGEKTEDVVQRIYETGGEALYNRFRLREHGAKGKTAPAPVADHDLDVIRHYAIAIGWDDFSVWLLTPLKPALCSGKTFCPVSPTIAPQQPAASLRPRAARSERGATTPAAAAAAAIKTHLPSQTLSSTLSTARSAPSSVNKAEISEPAAAMTATQTAWRGCHMERLTSAFNNRVETLSLLAQWIQGIHHWGTTEYASGVERDIMGDRVSGSGSGLGGGDAAVVGGPEDTGAGQTLADEAKKAWEGDAEYIYKRESDG